MSEFKTKTNAPVRKIKASGLAGALVILIFYFIPGASEWPDEVKGAVLVIVQFLVGYITPPGKSDGIKSNH